MSIELKIPAVGESVQEVQIGRWLLQPGESVQEDQSVVELETDKASLEVPAPRSGVLEKILKKEGETVSVGEVIGYIQEGNGKPGGAKQDQTKNAGENPAAAEKPRLAEKSPEKSPAKSPAKSNPKVAEEAPALPITPSARRALREHRLSAVDVEPAGDRIRREDVIRHVEHAEALESHPHKEQPPAKASGDSTNLPVPSPQEESGDEIRKMSLIRKRIAQRLVAAQQTAALLTTFNEIDMSAVIALRKEHGERFTKRYGIKLGFMSFFVKASIDALRQFPELNAEIRGEDQVVYHQAYHIGVAIGATKGLVVPVVRNAQWLSFAETELAIADFGKRAEENKLEPHELAGGTFTITNGGVYGSLLSTPIVNPPQSGVLGMHSIQERPIGKNGQIVLAPMMYVALTYDHRLIDGKQAVLFLRRIKEAIEEPARMLVEV
jgi:2-oxoglutarate dehydrogenase E2 component (dihydrolipoamide succinyltransferase)